WAAGPGWAQGHWFSGARRLGPTLSWQPAVSSRGTCRPRRLWQETPPGRWRAGSRVRGAGSRRCILGARLQVLGRGIGGREMRARVWRRAAVWLVLAAAAAGTGYAGYSWWTRPRPM